MDQAELYIQAIREAGGRVTAQRREICEYLAMTRDHPTPSQVYEALADTDPDISRATVYNTLNMLQELGVIVGISFGGGHTHFDTNAEPHVNLVCLRCHSITDVPIDRTVDVDNDALHLDQFEPVAFKMDVFGFCEKCRMAKRHEIQNELSEAHAKQNQSA